MGVKNKNKREKLEARLNTPVKPSFKEEVEMLAEQLGIAPTVLSRLLMNEGMKQMKANEGPVALAG